MLEQALPHRHAVYKGAVAATGVADFPAGVIKLIPIALHQWVERIVGPVLIILAFVSMTEAARAFFVAMGIIIFAVERLTAYRSTTD